MSNEISHKVATVKLGGSTIDDERVLHQLAEDISYLSKGQMTFLIVHGASSEISREMQALDMKPVRIEGLRVTDDAVMGAVERAMNRVNDHILSIMKEHGLDAEKVLGSDGLLLCKKHPPIMTNEDGKEIERDLGRVGEVEKVAPEKLELLLRDGKLPVIAPYGTGADGRIMNVNADTAAGNIAGACSDELILLTDVDGVVISKSGGDQVAESLKIHEVKTLMHGGVIQGGMLPKVEACMHALECGVKVTRIVNGFSDHPLRMALSQTPIGTRIIP